jgi:hypothetical protein
MLEKVGGLSVLELYQLAFDAKKKSALLLDSEIRQLINNPYKDYIFQAEREGFEPSNPYGLRALQARGLNHLSEIHLKPL